MSMSHEKGAGGDLKSLPRHTDVMLVQYLLVPACVRACVVTMWLSVNCRAGRTRKLP
jgi:hypothetical protein